MERLGLPTASIITHVFNNTAKAMTRMMGVPDFEYIVAEHPLSSLTDEQCRERAEVLLPDVERILVGSAAAKADQTEAADNLSEKMRRPNRLGRLIFILLTIGFV